MSTVEETTTRRQRSWLYITAIVLLVALAVGGLLAFRGARVTQAAQSKADELIALLEDRGARAPSREQIVHVLGADGGAVCANPNDALSRAIFLGQLANGAAGPGYRPVIADNKVVQGQLAIMQVYCPDQLPEFVQTVEGLKLDEKVAG
ncbi:hypothetical protein [Georgenia thermotolerans]|uniref:Uncharacterized protein n=1 Tax=Georgenia thermotolerans TaxID=527326 RepID=A0A7J5USB2_9MICO|nr:hypothetical protein [Georgenia thermotolerans]KAE8765044.1 hypothetical protein GB883_06030 [Georgenia thermotolerans]